MNPVLCYVRARLRRRLFLWFGATILLTGVAVASVMSVFSSGREGYRRELERVRALAGDRFGEVWEDPRARAELAAAVSRDLEVTVRLEGPVGEELAIFGAPCGEPSLLAEVTRGGRIVGAVSVCAERYGPRPFRFAIPLIVTGFVLWGAAGALARRIARPLDTLTRMAQEIGAGNFSARVKLGRRAYGETVALAYTLNEMAARIERHLTEQRELLAAVSHEMRTPLARIRLLTEMARDGMPIEKTLDDLDREVVEMDALVGDLLASSRLEFAVLSPRPLVAAEAAARALERAGVDAGALSIAGEGEREGAEAEEVGAEALGERGPAAEVLADATLLGRALSNLIDNAKKHGGGVSRLRVVEGSSTVAFEVEDRGRGLPEGEEARVFEPFYRRSEQGSLGLGLSLVKRIAEAHGGRAYAENRAEGGARVGIALPRSGGITL